MEEPFRIGRPGRVDRSGAYGGLYPSVVASRYVTSGALTYQQGSINSLPDKTRLTAPWTELVPTTALPRWTPLARVTTN